MNDKTLASGVTLQELSERPVTDLKGVGSQKARSLAKIGVETVLDVLFYYHRRYLDRTREATLESLEVGDEAMVLIRVESVVARRTRRGKSLVEIVVGDSTGSLVLIFFNQPWRERQLIAGTEAVVFGKLDLYRNRLQMTNPVVDLIGNRTGRIVAVYPQSESAGLQSWDFDEMSGEAIRRVMKVRGFYDPVPAGVLNRYKLVDRSTAYRGIHRPESMKEVAEARRRLVFDELLRVQLALVTRKLQLEHNAVGIAHTVSHTSFNLVEQFHRSLGFALTEAQIRVVDEILGDMARPTPMHRLLQGDVGSGKTVVAISALLASIQGGYQGALMAPTEVLAEQHYLAIIGLLGELEVEDTATLHGRRPVAVRLLTNRVSASERRRMNADLVRGSVDLLIGTHALIQESVEFDSLGAVVIDEQHRFGVEQRDALRRRNTDGSEPDVLVMTATPIPRTAAMTVYGDLDVSVLDQLPPGRVPIETEWTEDEESAWSLVSSEVSMGHQAFVVCPLIDESDALQVRSAEETHSRLIQGPLADTCIGLLHGRVSPAEREETMELFRAGAIDVLVATTVVEVGVDIPNATVMVILDPARFGIAQLHQLRGRVGRGVAKGRCILVGPAPTPDAEARMRALVSSTDGFELAEIDLDLRGEGTIMGERQKGRNDLRLASLRRDREWVEVAREVAETLVSDVQRQDFVAGLTDEVDLLLRETEADFLLKS